MQHLRPVERRVLRMRDEGLEVAEIGRRIRKSPETVERMISWTEYERPNAPTRRSPSALGRRVLALRSAGETHQQIGERFRRGPDYIRQVEGLAHYQLGLELLSWRRQSPESRAT